MGRLEYVDKIQKIILAEKDELLWLETFMSLSFNGLDDEGISIIIDDLEVNKTVPYYIKYVKKS